MDTVVPAEDQIEYVRFAGRERSLSESDYPLSIMRRKYVEDRLSIPSVDVNDKV